MGRILKIVAGLVGGAIVLFTLAAVALMLFFDPNDFREDVAKAVYEQTGRELVIDGDVSVSVFPWLAVKVGKTTLGDAPGFGDEPFATFDNASFSARLLPLIVKQELVVGAADLDNLNVNLKVNAAGVSNWSDLAAESETAAETPADDAATTAEVNINRIDLSNATIVYSNAESGERIELTEVNLSVGQLRSDGSPVPLDGSLNFDVRPAALSGEVAAETTLSYNADDGQVALEWLTIEGTIEGLASIPTKLLFKTDGVAVDTQASSIAMQPLELELLGMSMSADVEPFTYDDRVTPKAKVAIDAFSPRSLMPLFDVEPPVTADPNVLSSISIDATVQLQTDAIAMTGVNITLDDTTFTGNLSVPRTDGAYTFDLRGDALDVTRYMEPASDEPVQSDDAAVPVEIPVDLIRTLNARGKVTLDRATLGAMVFENIELGLNSGNGRLRLHPIASDLFSGSYSGDVRVDVSGNLPSLSVDERIANVDMADLAKAMFKQDNVTGTINGEFKLAGRGADLAAVQRDLDGTMAFRLQDGTYEGTDIWYELRKARAALKGEEPPEPTLPPRTRFSTVTATGVVTKGVMRNDDLYAELPHMQITGAGQVNLAEARVDYGLTARILERPEMLTDATAEELEEFTEAVIPLKITGPLTSPSVQPDLEKLLRQRVEDEIKDRLKDKLGDLFG